MENKKILIIEDDPDIAQLVEIHLVDLGFEVEKAADGKLGLEKALAGEFALLVLDLMLPKIDGLTICRNIRQANKNLPILMLTAKSEEIDKIIGFELGADDYLSKPFGIGELLARVKALLRRAKVEQPESEHKAAHSRIVFKELSIDLENRVVSQHGNHIKLTVKEFDLLVFLASRPTRPFSREELLHYIWDYEHDGYQHTVTSHINRLRSKLEDDPSNPKLIQTVWGIGYRFSSSEEEDEIKFS